MAFFEKIKNGLKKTRENVSSKIDSVLAVFTRIDDDLFEELEDALITADIGAQTTFDIIEKLRATVKLKRITDPTLIKDELKDIISNMITEDETELKLNTKPSVILLIGVNGVGKTTTAAKLAKNFKDENKKVIFGAADTFRAAAADQLELWAKRVGVDIVRQNEGADPAAVVFDTISAAKARNADLIIIDTAGRLHNKVNLMNELEKIYRVIKTNLPESDVESLLILDSTTGQNAINQAREFKKVANVTGVILTKLDGTAKGGIAIAIKNELSLPIRYIGVGEQMDDLQPFDANDFANALF